MKSTCLIISLMAAVCAASVVLNRQLDAHWEHYKAMYGKTYSTSHEELTRSVFIIFNILLK